MPHGDINDRVARYIKDLEERVGNLEERSRADKTPNFLVNISDGAGVDDAISVERKSIETAQWNNRAFGTAAWGKYE